MKKIFILIGTIILSLVITFVGAEVINLYRFGDTPTILTLSYLISIFSILEDILLSSIYLVKKKLNKEKIGLRKIVGIILLFLALLLILWFIVTTNVDWLNYYSRYNTRPFSMIVLVNVLEFILPSIILIIISIFLIIDKKVDK